jgi:hypothetical protein
MDAVAGRLDVKGLADQAAADLPQKGLGRAGGLGQNMPGSLASGVAGLCPTVSAPCSWPTWW